MRDRILALGLTSSLMLAASTQADASTISLSVTGQISNTAANGVTSNLASTQTTNNGNPAQLVDSFSAHGASVGYDVNPTGGSVGTINLNAQSFSHAYDFDQTRSDASTQFTLMDSAFVNGPLSGPLSGTATLTFHGSFASGTEFQDSYQSATGFIPVTVEADSSFTTRSSQFTPSPVVSSDQRVFYDVDACGGTPGCGVGDASFTASLTTDWTVTDADRQIDILATLHGDAQNGGSFLLNSVLITFYLPPGTFLSSSGNAFLTSQTIAATPIPGSIILFASALIGLGLIASHRKILPDAQIHILRS